MDTELSSLDILYIEHAQNRGRDIFADWMWTTKIWWVQKKGDLQYYKK